MSTPNVALILLVVGILSAGQILFKLAALSTEDVADLWTLINVYSLFAVFLYALATAIWLYLLREVPIGVAYPILSLSFVVVPILAFLLFGEPYNIKMLAGSVLIILGVYLFNT